MRSIRKPHTPETPPPLPTSPSPSPGNGHVVLHIIEHSGLHIEPSLTNPLATAAQLGPCTTAACGLIQHSAHSTGEASEVSTAACQPPARVQQCHYNRAPPPTEPPPPLLSLTLLAPRLHIVHHLVQLLLQVCVTGRGRRRMAGSEASMWCTALATARPQQRAT